MKTAERVSVFTSPKARARFLTVYEDGLDRGWPTRVAVDVPTSFGATRVYRSGQPDGIPVVLLPGAGGNALMWQRYVEPLGRRHPVIAIDPVGEPGASTQDSPVTSWSQWLGEVLAGLPVERAHLVGCSYGGWIAVEHALRGSSTACSPSATASAYSVECVWCRCCRRLPRSSTRWASTTNWSG